MNEMPLTECVTAWLLPSKNGEHTMQLRNEPNVKPEKHEKEHSVLPEKMLSVKR